MKMKKPNQFCTSQMPSRVVFNAYGGENEAPNVLIHLIEAQVIQKDFGFRLTARTARLLSQWFS